MKTVSIADVVKRRSRLKNIWINVHDTIPSTRITKIKKLTHYLKVVHPLSDFVELVLADFKITVFNLSIFFSKSTCSDLFTNFFLENIAIFGVQILHQNHLV